MLDAYPDGRGPVACRCKHPIERDTPPLKATGVAPFPPHTKLFPKNKEKKVNLQDITHRNIIIKGKRVVLKIFRGLIWEKSVKKYRI